MFGNLIKKFWPLAPRRRPTEIDRHRHNDVGARAARLYLSVGGFSRVCAHIFSRSKFSSRTLLQHPPMHSCFSCYAFGRQVAAFRGGIVGKVHKRNRTNPDRRILATPALWNVVGRLLSFTHRIHAAAALAVVCAVYASRHTEGER